MPPLPACPHCRRDSLVSIIARNHVRCLRKRIADDLWGEDLRSEILDVNKDLCNSISSPMGHAVLLSRTACVKALLSHPAGCVAAVQQIDASGLTPLTTAMYCDERGAAIEMLRAPGVDVDQALLAAVFWDLPDDAEELLMEGAGKSGVFFRQWDLDHIFGEGTPEASCDTLVEFARVRAMEGGQNLDRTYTHTLLDILKHYGIK